MKRIFKASLAVFAAASLTLGLAACTGGGKEAGGETGGDKGTQAGGTITFQTWSLKNDRFTPYFEKLIADFEKENPGTTIKWLDQPGEGYEAKILQQANSNELPDVVNLPPEFAYKLAKVGKLNDLEAADSAILNDYVKGGVEAYKFPDVEGSYGYPWYLGTDLNWWNLEQFKKAGLDESRIPKSGDELFALAEEIAAKTNGEVKIISESPKMGTMSNAGITMFKDGKWVFHTPEAEKLIGQYAAAFKSGAMPAEALTGDWLGNSASYKQGKVAWTTASAGYASELEKDAPSLLAATKVTPRFGQSPLFVQGISVAKESKSPELALKFAQYVTNDANQVAFLKIARGFFPGTKASNENPAVLLEGITNELQKTATEEAAKTVTTAYLENPIQYTQEMDKYFQQQVSLAVRGDISPAEALEKAQKYCNDQM
ncbi:MAG: extracellular solute-binding protein [Actinomycetaceae bacterium]|nr:extracellular solute-binding protein [Actinomycetaceae bacterium]